MSEFSYGEFAVDGVSDPRLLDAIVAFNTALEPIEEAAADNLALDEAHTQYSQRSFKDTLLEHNYKPALIESLQAIGKLAHQLDEHPIVETSTIAGESYRHYVPVSRLTRLFGGLVMNEKTTMLTQEEVALVDAATNHIFPDVVIDLSGIEDPYTDMATLLQRSTDMSAGFDSAHQWKQDYIKALGNLPPQDAIDIMTGLAFCMNAKIMRNQSIVGILTSKQRQHMLKNADFSLVTMYEAARLTDFALLGASDASPAQREEHDYLRHEIGLTTLNGTSLSSFEMTCAGLATAWEHVKTRDTVQQLTSSPLRIDAKLRYNFRNLLSNTLPAMNQHFYQQLSECGDDINAAGFKDQLLAAEHFKNTRLQNILSDVAGIGYIRQNNPELFRKLLEPRLQNAFVAEQSELLAAERQQKIDDVIAKINDIERPYRYTSGAIRNKLFPQGPAIIRELETELTKKDLPTERTLAQSLAMLIMQAQVLTKDKTKYFDQLLERQQALEEQMQTLTTIGADTKYASPLLNALHLLSEMGESNITISHPQLKLLAREYWHGPGVSEEESQSEPSELAQTPMPDEPSPVPNKTEVTPVQDSDGIIKQLITKQSIAEAKRAKIQADRKRAQETYDALLNDLLDQEDIAFIDVIVPKRSSDRSAAGRVTQQREASSAANHLNIDRARLEGLLALRNQLRAQGKHTSLYFVRAMEGKPYPPILLYVQRQPWSKQGVLLIEPMLINNASRLNTIDGEVTTDARDIVTLRNTDLKELGIATDIRIHKPKGSPMFKQHYSSTLLNLINERLATLKRLG